MFHYMLLVTGTPSHAPTVTPVIHIFFVILVLSAILVTHFWHSHPTYGLFWRRMQYVQVIVLYSWYLFFHFDLSECLPLYHCRIAILVMLFSPESKLKTYFAYLGTAGAICALAYPIFDPYPFPHVTILSYVIGHLALLINSLIYLYGSKEKQDLSMTEVVKISLLMNLFIAIVNMPLNANYGFLKDPPLLSSANPLVNLLVVTLVVSLLVMMVQTIFSRQAERFIIRV